MQGGVFGAVAIFAVHRGDCRIKCATRLPKEPRHRANSQRKTSDAVEPEPAPRFDRLELKNLFQIAENADNIPWQPFRDGVDIYRLYGDGASGPTAALIRFRAEGTVPMHEHQGYEHILVLSGSQRIKIAQPPRAL
jgi:hypothetical protein